MWDRQCNVQIMRQVMKRLGTLAVGLVLLISAAAATGNGNTVSVDINQEVSGICITEGEMDQSTFAYSSVWCRRLMEIWTATP